MGLRYPNQIPTRNLAQEGSVRVSGAQPFTIDTVPLNSIANAFNEEEQIRINRNRKQLEFLSARAKNEADELRVVAQSKLSNVRGSNSFQESDKQRQWLVDATFTALDKYDPKFRPFIERDFAQGVSQFNQYATKYTYGQAKAAEDNTFKERIANEMNSAIERSGNEADFSEGLDKVVAAIAQSSNNLGDSREVLNYKVKAGVSESVRRAVELQASTGDFERASNTIKRFNDDLLPDDLKKALNTIDVQRKKQGTSQASQIADMAWEQSNKNPARALEIINTLSPNDRVRSQSTSFLNSRITIDEKQKAKNEEAVIARVNDIVRKGGNAQDITREVQQLPFDRQLKVMDAINKNRGGSPRVTDRSTYKYLMDKYNRDEQEFGATDLNAFIPFLSEQDLNTFQMMKNRITSGQQSADAALRKGNEGVFRGVIENYFQANKIRNPALQGKISSNARNYYEKLLLEPNPDPIVIKRKLEAALASSGFREEGFLFWKKKVATDSIIPTEQERPEAAQVHPSVVSRIKDEFFRRRGREMSPSEVNLHIQNLRSQGIDVTSPR